MEDKKFVLLANFSKEEVFELISWYKQNKKLPPSIFASVTETVLKWRVSEWLQELENEDKYFHSGKR